MLPTSKKSVHFLILSFFTSLVLAIGIYYGTDAVFAAEPACDPPGCNVSPPLQADGSTSINQGASLKWNNQNSITGVDDIDDTRIYIGTGGDLRFYNDSDNQVMHLQSDGDLFIDKNLQANTYYDRNNTSYYMNPAGTNRVNYVRGNYVRGNRLRADNINLDGNQIRFYRSSDSTIKKTTNYLELHGRNNSYSRIWLADNRDRIYIGDGNTDIRLRGKVGIGNTGGSALIIKPSSVGQTNAIVVQNNSGSTKFKVTKYGSMETNSTARFNSYAYFYSKVWMRRGLDVEVPYAGASAIEADGSFAGVYAKGDTYAVYARGGSYGVLGYGTFRDFYASGPGVNYAASSSIRWKDNITQIPSALDKVMQLRGVYFDWDEEHGGQHDVGMIAEEVGEVLPEIVAWEEDGEYAEGLDYSKLTPLLVEAVKEQQEQIGNLQKQNQELLKRVEALEGR